MPHSIAGLSLALVSLLLPLPADRAAAAEAPQHGAAMDYGPFLTGSLDRDREISAKHSGESTEQLADYTNALAAKAVNVRLAGEGGEEAAVAFDTDLLRYAAGWTGGFVQLDKTHLTSEKGSVPLTPAGPIAFETPNRIAGWSADGGFGFVDPRAHPWGPLPRDIGRYRGLYRHGRRLVFRYTIGGTDVLDMPGAVRAGGRVGFARTVKLSGERGSLALLVCDAAGAPGTAMTVQEHDDEQGLTVVTDDPRRAVAVAGIGVPAGARWFVAGGRIGLSLPAAREPATFKVVLSTADGPDRDGHAALVAATGAPDDLEALTGGGPALWPERLTTKGRRAADDKSYVVDSLELPFDNPWKAWLRPTGFDFFSDGRRLAFCTWSGDVWVASGIDDALESVTWRRYAAGLYEPLGLKIVDDKVYVLGRDQITRLHDLNDDGEADFYENFNNDAPASSNYHDFAYDLQTDSRGNFYYSRTGHRISPKIGLHGCVVRVSPDGSGSEAIAAGFRAANGMGVGPGDLITNSDNQGNWTPTTRINVVRPGGFYGYMPHVASAGGPVRADYDPPLCWVPLALDNSGGGQVWADGGGRWGPLDGQMLHTSYGRASLLLVLTQAVDADKGLYNGGVVRLPLRFDSGVMRGRWNPVDGQVYLCGLKGWQTAGPRDGTICRMRYTGKPAYLPVSFRVVPGAVELSFSEPLDPETAADPDAYAVERWNYQWTEKYGSPEFSVKEPERQGRDAVEVESVKLSADGQTATLSIPDLAPVMQMMIRYNLDAADGTEMADELYLTINRM